MYVEEQCVGALKVSSGNVGLLIKHFREREKIFSDPQNGRWGGQNAVPKWGHVLPIFGTVEVLKS